MLAATIRQSCLLLITIKSEKFLHGLFCKSFEDTMKPTRTWIVIADGSRAHILLNEGADKGLSFVPGSDFRHARAGLSRGAARIFELASP